MEILFSIFYILTIIVVLAIPVHFAGLNKKPKALMGHIRTASWLWGWTIIGWVVAMVMAFMKNPPE